MLNAKFKKVGCAIYISHIDMLRAINRTFNRAGFKPNHSKGFNPHILLNLSSPLPLGVQSQAEYLTLSLDNVAPSDFIERFNQNAPDGIRILNCVETTKTPNWANNLTVSTYFISTSRTLTDEECLLLKTEPLIVTYKTKDGDVTKDIQPMVINVEPIENAIVASLSCGNVNLRVDRFCSALVQKLGITVDNTQTIKISQSSKISNDFMSAEELLNKIVEEEAKAKLIAVEKEKIADIESIEENNTKVENLNKDIDN